MLRKINFGFTTFIFSLLLLLLVSLLINGVFFPGDILGYFPVFSTGEWHRPHNSLLADPVFQFEPWRVFAKEQITSGNIPLWNSFNGLGVPFLANPQTALFFPLTILSFFLSLAPGQFFIHAVKVFIFAFFTFHFLRSIHLGKRASLLGSMAASFSSFFLTWILWPHTNVFMVLPILLLIIEKIATTKTKKTYFYILFSLCTALASFGGHPETLLQIGLLVIAYCVYRLNQFSTLRLKTLLFGFFGLLLSSVQLFPFLEYLMLSSAWINRAGFTVSNPLPFSSLILNIFPFLLGAPHVGLYKAIPGTNFQEAAGGYVGVIIIILAVASLLTQRRIKTVLFWGIIGLFSFSLAYSIPPISFINQIPVLDRVANARFLGVYGFSAVILGSFMIDFMLRKKIKYKLKKYYLAATLPIILVLPVLFLPQITSALGFYPPDAFLTQLQNHLLLLILSSFFFFLVSIFLRRFKLVQFFLLSVLLFLQTGFLFLNYVPFVQEEKYYPRTELINVLGRLPEGPYLEVGNPTLKENSNLIYGLRSVEDYDAIEIHQYKISFDRAFPIKNHWGNVDQINEKSLRDFGIRYLLSDYDLRLLPQAVEGSQEKILSPLASNVSYRVAFKPKRATLSGIRVLTANFNRHNTCLLFVSLRNTQRELYANTQNCEDVRDKMYLFIPFPDIPVSPDEEYEVIIRSNGTPGNAVALWGESKPFIQLFYKTDESGFLMLHSYKDKTFLFEYPGARSIVYPGDYKIVKKTNAAVLVETSHARTGLLIVKIPFFPGWKATVDGIPVRLVSHDAFLSLLVPQGRHVVEVYFSPDSFYLGCIVSVLVFVLLVLVFLRAVIRERFIAVLFIKWRAFASKSKLIPWWQHAVVIMIGVCISLVSYVFMIKLIDLHFTFPQTTAINWYTVYRYPRQQDYFYFYTCMGFVVMGAGTIWLVWLWIKNKL